MKLSPTSPSKLSHTSPDSPEALGHKCSEAFTHKSTESSEAFAHKSKSALKLSLTCPQPHSHRPEQTFGRTNRRSVVGTDVRLEGGRR